ncbi:hypothetical protein [Synechococcus sp. GEYO]|nr:hypothetical protein [Synechococcus sp. GEYO]
MASFNADILLDVNTSKSEKKVKQLERNIQKVEGTSTAESINPFL